MSDEGEEELSTLAAIYPELMVDGRSAELELAVRPNDPILIQFSPDSTARPDLDNDHTDDTKTVAFSNLPPLKLHIQLPKDYPESNPPIIFIETDQGWLSQQKRQSLAAEANTLWEDFGRTQVLFAYIDLLQGMIEQGFDLNATGGLTLPKSLQPVLSKFDQDTRQAIFNAGTFECGVCLEPKKGLVCYQLQQCKHVFCKTCLQDFYENAIKEGDVKHVECLEPDCGKDCKTKRKQLHPRELLAIGIEEASVRRMVELKRKKKREADKTTVYCPRSWCQAPARSARYPPIPADLNDYVDLSDEEEELAPANGDYDERLTVCENPKCGLAFCRTCCASWHGAYVRCYPRDTTELSAEEQASYDYIQRHTSPCPTCNSPTQKTMGCNHMNCFQCNTHFCYLCAAWLDGGNPYQHFNTPGTPCYERLWELEEGDEGQGPQDGRGFGGARAWEAMALDAVREAQREEVEAAAAIDQVEQEQVQAVEPVQVQQAVPEARRPPGRRRMYRGPAHPPAAPAQRPPRPPRPVIVRDGEVDDELRRFVELALRDEEDGWDSDELADDDDAWRIR